ncbi:tyrosine-protein phosphatase [Bacillus sp. OTU530]|uniref:tyrosine-protein phosphatase n=1 Tax=Bacillus sp. OTU530 TaxID=3043862 RepID=UPI00313F0117
MYTQSIVRLPLKNAFNVRELGGYPNSNGKVTKHHYLLRADDLFNLDENDIDLLLSYGVTAVVDLRSAFELSSYPDPFSKINQVNYINIPLLADDVVEPDITKVMTENLERFLTDIYLGMIKDSTEAIRNVFEFIAKQEGCVLFHCAAGKDRTGIIAMLLLGLAEVSRPDIIANYILTEVYIKENTIMQQNAEQIPAELMQSKPAYIEPVIDYILSTFENFENYLIHIGLTKELLLTIKNKMILGSFQLRK